MHRIQVLFTELPEMNAFLSRIKTKILLKCKLDNIISYPCCFSIFNFTVENLINVLLNKKEKIIHMTPNACYF